MPLEIFVSREGRIAIRDPKKDGHIRLLAGVRSVTFEDGVVIGPEAPKDGERRIIRTVNGQELEIKSGAS